MTRYGAPTARTNGQRYADVGTLMLTLLACASCRYVYVRRSNVSIDYEDCNSVIAYFMPEQNLVTFNLSDA